MQESSAAPKIRTPDQRLRVFVSSTLQELAPERAAAREAIAHLRLTPVLFELGARPHPPRDLYRAYLAQSDIFLGIYWERYGWIAPNMDISGLEDEYRLSGDRPKLIYVKTPAPERESALKALLDRLKADDNASYKSFQTTEELHDLIENDLALLLTERFDEVRAATPTREAVVPELKRVTLPVLRTPLVDRIDQSEKAQSWLTRSEVGLVTLTGPGGAGKTHLALHIATQMQEQFADGVVFVPLAPLSDAALLAATIATTLGLRESSGQSIAESLIEALRDKQLLLVLDNFEQVVKGAPLIAQLLESCPRLKILITSRRKLHVRGEKELPIPPLDIPPETGRISVEHLAQYAAVDLFMQRAQDAKPSFSITPTTARAIAQICRRLDGLPLAIELAAARIKVLPPKALLAHLDRALPLLSGGARDLPARQQTMTGAIAWSYDLLDEPEKMLLRRMAVFVGGCTLEAAEAICNGDGDLALDILEGTETLVDSSLLTQDESDEDEARFRMLGTIREYALERLEESGEAPTLQRRHAECYLALVEEAEPYLTSAERWEWLARLDAEHNNVRAALEWSSAANEGEIVCRLVGGLGWFWFLRGYLSEGRTWADTALKLAASDDRSIRRAKVLHWAAGMAFAQGDYRSARAPVEESVAIFREHDDKRELGLTLIILGLVLTGLVEGDAACSALQESIDIFRGATRDPWGEAFALYCLGDLTRSMGDLATARKAYEESLASFQDQEDQWGRAVLLHALGMIEDAENDYPAARALFTASESLFREMGDRWDLARVLVALERVAMHEGDYQRALVFCEESLNLSRDLGNKNGMLRSLEGLATISLAQGDAERAARLLGTVDAISHAIGRTSPEPLIAEVKAKLDESAFAAAWSLSTTQTLEEAASYAAGESNSEDDGK
jgi:predicted ATPase